MYKCAALSYPLKLQWLAQPRHQLGIAVLSVLLLSPCLATRMVMDDYVLAVKAGIGDRVAGLPRAPLALFTFTTGDPARNQLLMDEGVLLPWWNEPQHLNAFFRPLSALTHLLDFRLWPQSAAAMHAHSLLWFFALLLALAHVYKRIEPAAPVLCGLALLLYALDDAHGATVGWISNRNAIISAGLALPALSLHRRWVVEGSAAAGWLAALCLLLGLCAGETALCIVGYLAAYALCLDTRSLRTRLLSLLPYVALLVAHRLLYRVWNLGSFGSSAYHDPLREPIAFARMLGYNLPVLLSAELFVPMADLAFWGDVNGRAALWCWSIATLAGLTWLAWDLLRRDAHARFWAVGMLLAAVPVSASLPGERLLLVLGFGGAALLARLLLVLWAQRRTASRARRVATDLLIAIHVLAAPIGLPVRAWALEPVARASDRLDAGYSRTPEIRAQTVIVLNAPVNALLSYLQVARAARGVPRPAHLYWLTSASSETTITRTGAHTLRVAQARGFLLRPEETHYRAESSSMPVGARVTLADMQARVVDLTADARPGTVDFSFAEPLESPRYLFRYCRDGELVPWRLPAPGRDSLRLPPEDFFRFVVSEALR